MSFKERLARFFANRYGGDSLNTLLSVISLISLIAAVIAFNAASTTAATVLGILFFVIAAALFGLELFRTFSKNKSARRAEYEWYRSHVIAPFKKKVSQSKTRRQQSATHRFFKCPKCRQTVRVPKGKGKIKITCPKCGETFIRKS